MPAARDDRLTLHRLAFLALALPVLGGISLSCTPEPSLSVELMTDLTAGDDFDGVYLERAQAPLKGMPSCAGDNLFDASMNYRTGAEVGAARRVHSGETWVVRVTLCHGDDVVMYRSVKSTIENNTELRVVMALSCLQVMCDGAGPCNYQTCEPSIECHWGDLRACQNPACGTAAAPKCPGGQECVAGECLAVVSDDLPDAGLDAGPPDSEAGADVGKVSPPDGGDVHMDGEAGEAGPPDARIAEAAAPTDGEAVEAEAEVPPAETKRVLYVGDALAAETAGPLRFWLGAGPRSEMYDAVGGQVAICDFLESSGEARPLAQKLAQEIKGHKPHLMVMQFWGDALTPCMADVAGDVQATLDRYKTDAEQLVHQIEQFALTAGVKRPKILWVLQGPDPDPALADRPKALNQIYAGLATRFGDRTSDPGPLVSAQAWTGTSEYRYVWRQFVPCLDLEKLNDGALCTGPEFDGGKATQLHRDGDDAPHTFAGKVLFCLESTAEDFKCVDSVDPNAPGLSPGANRYAVTITRDVNAWLGLTVAQNAMP